MRALVLDPVDTTRTALAEVLTVMNGKITYTQPEFAASLGLPQVGFRGNPTWWKRGTPEEARRARASQ